VLLLAPVWMQILHLLGADLYWVALVTLAAVVVWRGSLSRDAAQTYLDA
jgi:cytochrome c oxidase assembly protein subunit 15